jgi:nucleoside-diphosphate kinase
MSILLAIMDRTLIILKPDAVSRNLVGQIITRFENKGLQIAKCEFRQFSEDIAAAHYQEHKGKYFYEELISFMTSGQVMVMCLEGKDAVKVCRRLIGSHSESALVNMPGTIRGDFCNHHNQNLVHASDSDDAAKREIELFFPGYLS